MDKLFVVLTREYKAQVKSKAFVIGIAVMPVLMVGSIAIQKFMGNQVDTKDRRVAVIDHTGLVFNRLAALAAERNAAEIDNQEGKQTKPRFLLEAAPPATDLAQQRLALSGRVRDKELSCFVEVEPNVLTGDRAESGRLRYYSNSPTDREFPRWLEKSLNRVVQSYRFEQAHIPQEAVRKALQSVPLAELGLFSMGEDGQIKEAKPTDRVAVALVPFAFMMLIWVGVMIGATPLLQSVVEEKMQRIAEVLLGCVSPFELMLGKLLGVVGVSLTIIGIYLVGGYIVAVYYDRMDLFALDRIGWLLAFAALAIVMFGSMFCAIGASCSEMKDTQTLMTPVMIIVVLPMLCLQPVIESPSGSLATALSFVPPATPMIMIVRMYIPPGIPLWQPVLGIVGVLLFTALCVFAAGRIFRIGILMQGRPPKLRELARWALRG